MAAKVIAFLNEKGGVGKSSLCHSVGVELANQGRKVLLVDLDGQRANLSYIAGIDKPKGLATMYDVLVNGLDIKKAVLVAEDELQGALHIIPATADVSSLDNKNNSLKDMQKCIGDLKPYYDFIFFDISPTPNRGHALAMAAADGLIIPMLADVTSLEANMGVTESVAMIRKEINPELQVYGIVLNKFTWKTLLSREVAKTAEKMASNLGSQVFKTKVRQGVALAENVGKHQGVTIYAPKSKCADDIRALCKEIEEVVNHG